MKLICNPQAIFTRRTNGLNVQNLQLGLVALLGSLLIALSAQLEVLLVPVPVTLQTLAVLFIGMSCGARIGLASVALYLLEGALGLPVFAEACAGMPILFGPSGGYLIALLPAVILAASIVANKRNRYGVLLAGFAATVLIYAIGMSQLALWVGFTAAWSLGVKPFLFADALKLLVLAVMVPRYLK